ncbi:MAG: alkyl sulfatase C-terminal domain-containing protein [Microthrixaceae bacterium]
MSDTGEHRTIEVHRSVLNHYETTRATPVDLTITGPTDAVKALLVGTDDLDEATAAGRLAVMGNATAWVRFVSMLDEFRTWFHIVEP